MYNIFTSTSSFDSNHLFDRGEYITKSNPFGRKLTESEIIEYLDHIDGLIAGLEPLTKKVFKASPSLKVISRVGVGMDNVDLEAAEENGIKIFNTPDAPTEAVAELTIAMMLNLLRLVSNHDRWLKDAKWKRQKGFELKGKIIGIVGYGRIGKRVVEILKIFKTKILIYDPCIEQDNENFVAKLEDLLPEVDILSLHIPAVGGKKYFMDREELELLKDGAILLNLSRGGLINEEYLYDLLKSYKLGSAGLDVYENEPYCGKLSNLDNVLLTPHIGSFTKESRESMEKEAVENLIKGLTE